MVDARLLAPVPTLVLCGQDDLENGDPRALATAILGARLELVPGAHLSAVATPQLGDALLSFLLGPG